MKSKKVGKGDAKKADKVADAKVLSTASPKKNSKKSDETKPKVKATQARSKVTNDPSPKASSVKKESTKSEQKKSEKNTKKKRESKLKKDSKLVAPDMTMSIIGQDQIRIEPEKSKTKTQKMVAKKTQKSTRKKTKKSTKKEKIPLDIDNKSDIIAPHNTMREEGYSKSKSMDEDDDFKEGQKRKRKRREKTVEHDVEYIFKDSIDDPNGDARSDFNARSTDGSADYIWCQKMECRIYRKICGLYVKPACLKKSRCLHYDFGMMTKNKYKLRTLEDPKKESKKKGGDAGEGIDDEGAVYTEIETGGND